MEGRDTLDTCFVDATVEHFDDDLENVQTVKSKQTLVVHCFA